jgi:hypothetical protein
MGEVRPRAHLLPQFHNIFLIFCVTNFLFLMQSVVRCIIALPISLKISDSYLMVRFVKNIALYNQDICLLFP